MSRRGLGRIEAITIIAVAGLSLQLVALAMPRLRESSRGRTCSANLRELIRAMQTFEEAHGHLPAASRWTTAGMNIKQIYDPESGMEWWPNITAVPPGTYADTTHENWAIDLLPYLSVQPGDSSFDRSQVISATANESLRRVRQPVMTCPSDIYNTPENEYERVLPDSTSLYARGNYAINGGSQRDCQIPGNSSDPCIDGFHYRFDTNDNSFQWWGNGIAGINKHFASDEFTSGMSHVVAIEEVRAGVHRTDPRGVWSLGQIGGSITFSHGINGDATGPNSSKPNSDDIRGCDKLVANVGHDFLTHQRMGCCPHCKGSVQATSRSMHGNGVYLAMAGGEVRFVDNEIDRDIWHLMHSRETPPTVYENWPGDNVAKLDHHDTVPIPADAPREIENSIGMKFVLIPPGEFIMGLPDESYDVSQFPEVAPHKVRITKSFYLGMYEVTRGEWNRIMPTSNRNPESGAMYDRFPVVDVSWNDAIRFCNEISALPAEQKAHRGYRLPTEAEWEYACRSGRSVPYRFSHQRDPKDVSGDNGGHMRASLPVGPVGTYRANLLGIYDIRGNAYEWTNDWFKRDYYRCSPTADPQGASAGRFTLYRGSDWIFSGDTCILHRYPPSPWTISPYVGVRLICVRLCT
jgi:formylglycine-generating enzyme required for sulfatase activity